MQFIIGNNFFIIDGIFLTGQIEVFSKFSICFCYCFQ